MTHLLRLFRWVALLAGAVTLALVVVAVVLVGLLVVHFSAYRGTLETLASAAISRPVTIAGDMAIHPSLVPTLRVEGVRIGNPAWASRPSIAEAEALTVRFALPQLLQGRLVVDRFTLIGADVQLERGAEGQVNWVPSAPSGATPAAAEPAPALPLTAGGATVHTVRVRQGRVAYLNRATGERWEVFVDSGSAEHLLAGDLRVSARGRYREQPLSVELQGGPLAAVLQGEVTWPLNLSGRVADARFVARGSVRWTRPEARFDVQLTAQGGRLAALNPLLPWALPDWGPYRFEGRVSETAAGYHLGDFSARVGESRVEGDVTLAMDPRPRVTGTLAAPLLRLSDFPWPRRGSDAGAVPWPEWRLPVAGLRTTDATLAVSATRVTLPGVVLHGLQTRATLADGRLRLEGLRGTLATADAAADAPPLLVLQGDATYDAGGDTPRVGLQLRADGLDYGALLAGLTGVERVRGTAGRAVLEAEARGATPKALWQAGAFTLRTRDFAMTVDTPGAPVHYTLAQAESRVEQGRLAQVSGEGRYRGQALQVEDGSGGPLVRLFTGDAPWPVSFTARTPGGTRLVADGEVDWPRAGARYRFRGTLTGERLDDLAPLIGREAPALGPYRLSGVVRDDPAGVALSDLRGTLGESEARGHLLLTFDGPRPLLSGALQSDSFRLADLAPQPAATATEAASAALLDRPLPTERLRNVDLGLDVRVKSAVARQQTLRDIQAHVQLSGGRLDVSPLAASLAGVRFSGRTRYDASTDVPAARAHVEVGSLAVGPLLEAAGAGVPLRGEVARLAVSADSRGATLRDMWTGLRLTARSEAGVLRWQPERRPALVLTVDEGRVAVERGALRSLDVTGELNGGPAALSVSGGTLATLLAGDVPWPVDVRVEAADTVATADGTVTWGTLTGGTAPPDVAVHADVAGARLDTLGPLVGAALPAVGPYRVAAAVRAGPDGVALGGLEGTLGESDVGGRMVLDLAQRVPVLRATLQSRSLRAVDLLPRATAATEPAVPTAPQPGVLERPLPTTALRALDLDVDVGVGELLVPGSTLQDVRTRVRLTDGRLRLASLAATLGDVRFRGRGLYDASTEVPAAEGLLEAGPFRIDTLLTALGVAAPVSGEAGTLQISAGGTGATLGAMWRSLRLNARTEGGTVRWQPEGRPPLALEVDLARVTVHDGALQEAHLTGGLRGQPIGVTLAGGALDTLLTGGAPWPLDLRVEAPDTVATAKGTMMWDGPAGAAAPTDFALDVRVDGKQMSSLNPLLELDLPPLGPYGLGGRLTPTERGYRLRDVRARLGESRAQGTLSVDVSGVRPSVDANLRARVLQLDDFEWPEADVRPELPAVAAAPSDGRVIPARPFPVETLRRVDVNVELAADAVEKSGERIGDAAVVLTVHEGRLTLQPSRVRLFGSTIFGGFTLDASQDPPSIELEVWMQQVAYGRLLKVYDITDAFTGDADVGVRLKGVGADLRAFLGSANGTVEFVGGKGRIERRYLEFWGVDILRWWRPLLDPRSSSPLNCAVTAFELTDGVAKARVLIVDTDKVTVEGEGSINLRDERLELRLWPVPKSPSLFSLATPVRVEGPLAQPEIGPAPGGAAVDALSLLLGYSNPLLLLLRFGSLGTYGDNPCVKAVTKAEQNGGGKPDIKARTEEFLQHRLQTEEGGGPGGGPAAPGATAPGSEPAPAAEGTSGSAPSAPQAAPKPPAKARTSPPADGG